MANDSASCPDCTGTGTTAETRSADDGTFTVEVGNFSVGGYDGIVEVDGGDEHGVLVTYHFPAPTYAQPTAPVDVTLYVDARPNPGPLDVDRSTLEPDPRYRIARDEAAGGLTICSPVALHRCTAVRGQDAAERRWLAVDVDATASCDTLVQDARARCGEGTEPATLGCLARAGLFHDAAAVPVSATPEPPSGGIELRCAEGSATAAGP